jgi:thiamine biosynthesis lipoprotein
LATLEGQTMGTVWSLHAYLPLSLEATHLRLRVEEELDDLVRQMSHWREDSCLAQYNRAAAGMPVPLPAEFFTVLTAAVRIARETDGAFDPALGRAVNAWGFGPRSDEPESGAAMSSRREWERITLNPRDRTAVQPGSAALDLSAIAKGFAVDHLAALCDRLGVRHYLIEIGGELRGAGVKADGLPWWVAVETPTNESADDFPEILVALHHRSIATTGDYRRFHVRDGVRFSHTLDPRAGAPAAAGLASVTVVHESCMAADAYSTAIAALGEEAGLALAERLGLAACLVRREPAFGVAMSSAFARLTAE